MTQARATAVSYSVTLAVGLLEPGEIVAVAKGKVLIQNKFALPAWNSSSIFFELFENQKNGF